MIDEGQFFYAAEAPTESLKIVAFVRFPTKASRNRWVAHNRGARKVVNMSDEGRKTLEDLRARGFTWEDANGVSYSRGVPE